MDNDKLFDLMTKMYSDMQDMKDDMQGMKDDMQGMKHDMQGMKHDMNQGFKEVREEIADNSKAIIKLEAKIEADITDKIRGLYDNRSQVSDKLGDVDNKLDDLQVSVNNIGVKTLVMDSKIIDLKDHLK